MARRRMIRVRVASSIVAIGALVAVAFGQAERQAPPCSAPEYHQFDFWIGNWDVTTPDGKPVGTNLVRQILDGCVIEENWSGTTGGDGKSFNIYFARDRRWHQT